MPRNFLRLDNFTPDDLRGLLNESLRLKAYPYGETPLAGKSIGILFAKASTRTRVAFEVGIHQFGGKAISLNPGDIQISRGESLSDTAKVLSRYIDGMVVRAGDQSVIEELADAATVPVINALTDKFHPCQAVADFAALLEKKGNLEDMKLTYIGDGNNVANSLIIGAAMLGIDMHVASPEGYRPENDVLETATTIIKETGGKITVGSDPKEAAKEADAIYTDVWTSMGQEEEAGRRIEAFAGYTVNDAIMAVAKSDCVAMHCLPAHRGEEITASVIDGPRSIVWDQAEFKLHAQKAIMKMTMGDEN